MTCCLAILLFMTVLNIKLVRLRYNIWEISGKDREKDEPIQQ